MTPERKKYLASISKEERAIRKWIKWHENMLSHFKLTNWSERRNRVAEEKTIIKALKKQLPAPMAYLRDEYATYIGCSVCKSHTQPYFTHCYKCGQKLR